MSLVAQWLFNEASSGTTPTSVADSQASPVDLAITYSGAAAWTSDSGGNGLDFPGSGTATAKAAIGGTKLATAVTGSTQATVELRVRCDGADDRFAFALCASTTNANEALVVSFYPSLIVVFTGGNFQIIDCDTSGTHTYHIVYDTAQAAQADRVRVYKDNVLQSFNSGDVTQNKTLDFNTIVADLYVHCGVGFGTFQFDGAIFYAAYYDEILDATTRGDHHTKLVANHDANPNVVPPAVSSLSPTDGATGVSTGASLAITFDQNVQVGTGNVRIVEDVPPASAPTVQARNTDAQNTNATSFTIDIPGAGSIQNNDLAIIFISKDDNEAPTGTWPPTGWQIGQSDASGTTNWAGWIYRWCDGSTDGTTITLTESTENWLSRGWLIRGADRQTNPVGATVATGTSAAANPPGNTFPWGTDPTLVLYYVGFDGNASASAHPGGYSNTGTDTTTDATPTNRCGQAYGEKASVTSGSDDPGALTNTNEDWKAFTVAVRGAWTRTTVETIAITNGSQVSVSSATVTIVPTGGTLQASKQYHVEVDSGAIEASDDAADWAGISDVTTWNFTTGAAAGGAPPPFGGMRDFLSGRLPHLRM